MAGVIAAGVAGVGVSPGVASASTGAVEVTGTTTLLQVACASATVCVAVGNEPPAPGTVYSQGVVVPLSVSGTGAVTAGLPQAVPGFGAVSNVVCPNPGNCMIAGYGPLGAELTAPVTISSSGALTVGGPVLGPTSSLDIGFACAGGTCIGMSYYGGVTVAYVITPTGEEGPMVPLNLPGFGVAGLACASATVCLATSFGGSVVPLVVSASGITAGNTEPLGGTGGPVACASATLCLASVSSASESNLVPLGISSSGAISVGSALPPEAAPGPLPGASGAGSTFACPTSEVCESPSNSFIDSSIAPAEVVQTSVASSGVTADAASLLVPGATELNAVACPTANTCVLVGSGSSFFESGVVAGLQVPYPSVAPISGPSAGSIWTDIMGTGLSPGGASCVYYDFSACTGVTVYFGSTPAYIVYDSPTLIVVLTPAGPPGAVEVTVKGPGGSSTLIGQYTYT